MNVLQALGIVVVVLLALWLLFKIIGALTAVLSSVFGILIVVVLCYAVYHHLTHKKARN